MLKKYYLGGFFWAPTRHKQYQNISGFTGDTCRILPDMGFAMESQELKELSFCVIFRKNKWQQNFQKNAKCLTFFGPFNPNLGKNELSTKIGLSHFLASLVPWLQAKNQKKFVRQFWEKLLTNGRMGGQTDKWLNKQPNEQMNEWMNKWTNKVSKQM